jgi:hypothetical protein
MSLSNSVRTHLLDPVQHNNNRTSFRIPDGFYASSMKLVDLGVFDSALTATQGAFYPSITGVMSCVRNIYLYSDSTLIDSLQNCEQYASVEALKTSNQGSMDLNNQLLLNGMGLRGQSANEPATTGTRITAKSQVGSMQLEGMSYGANKINNIDALNNQVNIANAQDNQSGSVLLSRYLQFLETVSLLPMIPDLRVVFEWNTQKTTYYDDPDVGTTGALNLAVIRPTLIIDEVLGVDPAEAEQYDLPFLSTIVERFQVDPVATPANDSVPLRSSFKSQAFTQKYLKDIMFYNQPSSDLAVANRWLTKGTRSVAQKGEILQLVVNNSNHLPDQGITSPAQKFHYFNDTQTQLNLPLASATYGLTDPSGNVLGKSAEPLLGQFSVTACKVGATIDNLRIEYQRLYGTTASSRDAFTLLAFGTVAKTLSKGADGRVRVSY